MTSDLTAANRAAHKHTKAAVALICAAVLLMTMIVGVVFGHAASPGINNNGTDNVTIDIYGPYYKALAKETSSAYKRGGCAWYASSRASELVGRNLGVHSPGNWWNSVAAQNGFKKSASPVAKGFAIFSNHMVVIERVSGDTLTISEGSNPNASDAAHGYCAIRQVSRSYLEKQNYKGQSFRGYIDLGVRSDNPPTAETKLFDNGGTYVAQGSRDNKWHAYKGDEPQYTYTGIAPNPWGWWRIVNGNVDWEADGVYKNAYGWWRVIKGRVDFSFHGLATNAYGTWYIDGGKVDFGYNDPAFDWNGCLWTVENGKATVK